VAGVFLFLPLLARLRFDDLVAQAGYPGSGMIPPPAALLSLLTLKLLDKERRSHITDFDFDEALGLFAGLNVLPKKVAVHTPKANVQYTTLDGKPLKSVRNRHQANTILNISYEAKSTAVLEVKYRSYEMFTIIQEFAEKY